MPVVWSPELAVAVLVAVLSGVRPRPAGSRVRRRTAAPATRPPRRLVSADPRFGVVSTALYTAVVMVPGSSAGHHR